MRMYDVIGKKRDGHELTRAELAYAIDGYVKEEIPDYQMAALLMAIYLNGMTNEETGILTELVTASGEVVDLSKIEGIKVDKHSTGGVGDKTTLIIGPIVAACGVKVAKMSGRGLGHTGGTIDKLESIPGFQTTLAKERLVQIVNEIGLAVVGQSGNLAPADKKLYALRDVTATVDSIPLIAASIMGKKLASGNDSILLDIKMGSGAFMKNLPDALILGEIMVAIGERAGKRTAALITNMDVPLGQAIGNALEVREAIETLAGRGPADLTHICLELAANMLYLADQGSLIQCREMAQEALTSGRALIKFEQMIAAQGGDPAVVHDPRLLGQAPVMYSVKARATGIITRMDTEKCGIASSLLGAGRLTKDSSIDYLAGIWLDKKLGERVVKGEEIAHFYTTDESAIAEAEELFQTAVQIAQEAEEVLLIMARIDRDGIDREFTAK